MQKILYALYTADKRTSSAIGVIVRLVEQITISNEIDVNSMGKLLVKLEGQAKIQSDQLIGKLDEDEVNFHQIVDKISENVSVKSAADVKLNRRKWNKIFSSYLPSRQVISLIKLVFLEFFFFYFQTLL